MKIMGIQPWIFTGRTDAEAEAPVFWSSGVHRQLTEKVPDAGKDRGQRRKGHQRMRWLGGMNLGKLQEMVRDREAWHAAVHGVAKSQTRLGNWTPKQQILSSVLGEWKLNDEICDLGSLTRQSFIHPSIQWLIFECSNVPSGKMKLGYPWVQILSYHLLAVWPWTGFI